jgi:hypothetical protein
MKKEKRGGANRGQGRKVIDPEEKKKAIFFYVKAKHVEKAKKQIQPIVDKINSK